MIWNDEEIRPAELAQGMAGALFLYLFVWLLAACLVALQ